MAALGRIGCFLRQEAGVAAIEMAIIFPVLLILFFGMVDVTTLISDSRKVSKAADAVADILTRIEEPTTAAEVRDSFRAAEIAMRGGRATGVRVEVFTYRWDNGNPVLRWDLDNGVGQACASPDITGLVDLMTDKKDYVIAVVCVEHTPVVTAILGRNILGKGTFILRKQMAMPPRQIINLVCNDC